MSDLLATGTSALLAFQRAISTTSHNIANVETEGYTRQRVNFETQSPERGGLDSALGGGVRVSGLERLGSDFAVARVHATASAHTREAVHHELASRLDGLFSADVLDPAGQFSNLFTALEDASLDPSSATARELVIAEGESVAERMRTLQGRLEATAREVDDRRSASTDRINELAAGIADLNGRLVEHSAAGRNKLAADLLDRRDLLVGQLSAEVDAEAVVQDDGALNVSIGDGVPLVVGRDARTVRTVPDATRPGRSDIELGTGQSWQSVGARVHGGELGGLEAFESGTLEPAMQRLGRLAQAFAAQVNAVHANGERPDGAPGGTWFSIDGPSALAASANAGTGGLSANVTDANALLATDYRLRFDGGAWEITRTSDGTRTTNATLPTTLDGLEITATGAPSAGDSFLVSATRGAAGSLASTIASPDELAFAQPGAGLGGNENARDLAALGTARFVDGATVAEDIGAMAGTIGAQTSTLHTRSDALEAMRNDALERRDSISGVNLDEEAVDLVRHEQAYQAAAQVIRTADELFDTILGAIR